MTQRFQGRTSGPGGRLFNRRDFLKMGGAGLAGATLLGAAGCGGGGGGSFNGEVTLGFGREASGTLQKLIDKFNKQSNDIKVTWRKMPADTNQFFDQLRTQFQAQDDSLTLIGGDVIWPAQFAANSYIIDLSDRFTESMRSKFLQGPVESNTYEGKVYGVPWYTDAGLLYYRKDLLEKAGFDGPPKTWDELKDQAQQIMQDQGTKFGFVFQGAEYEGGVCNGLEYIWTHGGDVLDPNDPTKVVIDSPEAAEGLATEHSMLQRGVAPQSVSTYTETETDPAFLNGEAVFARNWPYMYALAGSSDFPNVKQDQVGISPIPVPEAGGQSSSTLGGWNFLINAASDKQDQAWEFIEFMTAPEQLITNAKQGSKLPTRQSLYDESEVTDNVPVARLGKEAIIQNSTARPVTPFYSDISLELAAGFNAALSGDTTPEAAVKSMQEEIESLIEQAG